MSDATIGLVGVGLLGTALAERLLGAGLSVRGFDLMPDRLAELVRLGGEADQTLESLATCPRLVLCLPDSTIVAGVIDRLASRLSAGQIVVDTTTGSPEDAERTHERLTGQGVHYGEATLLGSSEVARRGEAVAMLGGDADWLERSRDIVAAISGRSFHVGPPGSAARMKLVVNLVLGLHRAVLAEGLTLAEAFGLNLEQTLEILRSGAASSRVMEAKGRKMLERDYRAEARLSQHLKDVGLILAEAQKLGAATPLSAVHEHLLQQAVELGFGDLDNSAILEAFKSAE
jgi:3-hydroxyisobutyrate dehydrogenase-like beta-hydroxyacid dehydrogenase